MNSQKDEYLTETRDSTSTPTDKSNETPVEHPKRNIMMSPTHEELTVTINVGDLDISCLNEEIDLGTEIKITGLGDTLPIPSPVKVPRPIDCSNIVQPMSNTLHSAVPVISDSLNKKPKDRDRNKVAKSAVKVKESNNRIDKANTSKNRVDKTSDINRMDSDVILIDENEELDDCIEEVPINEPETPFYGNRIILGNKSKNNSLLNERFFNSKVLLNDCAEKLNKSSRYCKDCHVLFSSRQAFIEHKNKQSDDKYSAEKTVKIITQKDSAKKYSPVKNVKTPQHSAKNSKSNQCGICNLVLSNLGNLKRHINSKHDGLEEYSKRFPLKYKNRNGSNKESVVKSTDSKNDDNSPNENAKGAEGEAENYCSHCDKTFQSNEKLVKHLYSLLTPEDYNLQVDPDNRRSELEKEFQEMSKEDEVEEQMPSEADLAKIRDEVIKEARSKLGIIDNENGVKERDSKDKERDITCNTNLDEIENGDSASEDEISIAQYEEPMEMDEDGITCPKCDDILHSQVEFAKHELEHTNLKARNAKDCIIEVENLSLREIKKIIESVKQQRTENDKRKDLSLKETKFTPKKTRMLTPKKKLKPIYLKCPVCSLYIERGSEKLLELHMHKYHNRTDCSFELHPFIGYCKFCEQNFTNLGRYNLHVRKHLYNEANKFQKYKSRKSDPRDIFEYKCKVCKEQFKTLELATQHIQDNHPDTQIAGNIQKINVLKVTKHSMAVHQTIHNPPVPKSVLFKCNTCTLNFFTTFAAAIYLAKCPGPRRYWKCPDCYNYFKFAHQEMHEKQHLYSNNFKIYTVSDKNLNSRVLSKCPLCGIHFSEVRFWSHYLDCGREVTDSSYCIKCDILIDSRHAQNHRKVHSKVRTEDFIIIEYEIPGNELKRKSEDDTEAPVAKKIKSYKENEEADSDNDKQQILYCDCCKSYLNNLNNHQNSAHFEYRCKGLPKKMCNECGLTFTVRSMYLHKKQHEDGFSIYNVSFYDLSFKQIDPPLPRFPRCPVCMISFKDEEERGSHACDKPVFKKCSICQIDYSEQSYEIHLQYHNYPEHKVKSSLSRKKISQIQKVLLDKKNKMFTLYQCVDCNVVLTEEKVKAHQKIVYECVNLKNIYKHCPKCKLTFNCEDYHVHLRKHDDDNFSRRNIKVVPFDRRSEIVKVNNVKDQSYVVYQCAVCEQCLEGTAAVTSMQHSCKALKVWCSTCEINLCLNSLKKHRFDHTLYPDKNVNTIKIIRFNENKVGKKKSKKKSKDTSSEDETSTDSDDSCEVKELITLYQCNECKVNFSDETAHKCDAKAKTKKCDTCNYRFLKSDFEEHAKIHLMNPKYRKGHFKIVKIKANANGKGEQYKDTDRGTINEKSNITVNVKDKKETDNSKDVEKSKEEIVYKCTCGLHFVTEAGIIAHFSGCCNKKAKKQICTKCNLLFTPPVLFNHLVTHHAKNRTFNYKILEMSPKCLTDRDDLYKCGKCEIHFLSKSFAETHNESCKGGRVAPCDVCGLEFDDTMKGFHMRRHHKTNKMFKRSDFNIIDIEKEKNPSKVNEKRKTVGASKGYVDETKKNIYKCTKCEIHFVKSFSFKLHIESDHTKSMPYVKYCKKCDLKFANYDSHVEHHHHLYNIKAEDLNILYHWKKETKATIETKPVLYRCGDCDTYFLSVESLYKHVLIYEHKLKGPARRCDTCKKFIALSSHWRTHINHHHKEKQLQFNDFEVKTYPLKEHFEDDDKYSEKLYKCESCGVCFMNRREMITHKRSLSHCPPQKIVSCIKCNLAFCQVTLLEHERFHHHVRKLRLEELTIISSDAVILNTFRESANKDNRRIYCCKSCAVHYMNKKVCLKHVSKHIPVEERQKIKCKKCNIVFHSKSIKEHRNKHHIEKKMKPTDLSVYIYDPDNLKNDDRIKYRLFNGGKSVFVDNDRKRVKNAKTIKEKDKRDVKSKVRDTVTEKSVEDLSKESSNIKESKLDENAINKKENESIEVKNSDSGDNDFNFDKTKTVKVIEIEPENKSSVEDISDKPSVNFDEENEKHLNVENEPGKNEIDESGKGSTVDENLSESAEKD